MFETTAVYQNPTTGYAYRQLMWEDGGNVCSIRCVERPGVYVVSVPTILQSSFLEFKVDNQINNFDLFVDEIGESRGSSAELLPELAGRLCYFSYDKPRPGGNAAFLKRIKEEGHGCYDDKTEVLTLTGWKSFPTVTVDDLLATYDISYGYFDYVKPKAVVHKPYKGRMIALNSDRISLLVTPDHRMVRCLENGTWEFVEAQRLLSDAVGAFTKTGGNYIGTRTTPTLWTFSLNRPRHDIFGVFGLIFFKGTIASDYRGIVPLSILRDSLTDVRRVLNENGIYHAMTDTTLEITIPNEWRQIFLHSISSKKPHIPASFLMTLDFREAFYFVNGATVWQLPRLHDDGHIDVDAGDENLAESLQQASIHAGIAADVVKPSAEGYIVRIYKAPRTTIRDVEVFEENYDGTIHCVDLPPVHTVFVRRNGRVVLCGNSVLEHANFSFILTGVSRNMTLEGNRHRHFGISQLSGRYVDPKDLGFIVDPNLLDDPKGLFQWAKTCYACFSFYEKRFHELMDRHQTAIERSDSLDLSEKKARMRKITKQARELARDILPGCLETKVCYTANARALRFVFEKRCHEDAAFEIRRAFNAVYRRINPLAKNLFSDYEEISLEDGTFALKTNYAKV